MWDRELPESPPAGFSVQGGSKGEDFAGQEGNEEHVPRYSLARVVLANKNKWVKAHEIVTMLNWLVLIPAKGELCFSGKVFLLSLLIFYHLWREEVVGRLVAFTEHIEMWGFTLWS